MKKMLKGDASNTKIPMKGKNLETFKNFNKQSKLKQAALTAISV